MATEDTYSKRGNRYYKKPKHPKPPVTTLIPEAVAVFESLFPPEGDGPSVTTILGALAKPALINWAAKEERKMIALLAGQLYERLNLILGEPVTREKFVEMIEDEAGKGAHRQLLEKAANVGTQVHARIEWTLKGELGMERSVEPPPITSKQALRSWERWQEWRLAVNFKPIDIERKIFSTLFGYGGRLDLIADITIDGVTSRVVVDFKTGKAIYAEAYLQNVGYRMALQEEGIETDGGWIVRLPKYEDDPEFDAAPVPADPDLKTTFLALTIVFRWWEKSHNTKGKKKPKSTISGGLSEPGKNGSLGVEAVDAAD